MDFWMNKVNVSKKAAEQQVAIINSFSPEKRMKIALDFSGLGVQRTREWIKERHPHYSELEISLEFVKLMYYETGQMKEELWKHYESTMQEKIKEDWKDRFKAMLKANNWTYDDIAKMGGFKNGDVIKTTISRGLPSFAKLSVLVYENVMIDGKK